MSEAAEIAEGMIDGYRAHLTYLNQTSDIEHARKFIIHTWQLGGRDWKDYWSHQMLDNVAESLNRSVK